MRGGADELCMSGIGFRPLPRAGLATTGALGDVIVRANDHAVLRMSGLTDQLEQVGVGKSIKLALLRGG